LPADPLSTPECPSAGEPDRAAAERRALLRALRRVGRALDILSRRIDRTAGLTLPQYIVLSAVRDLGDGTSRAIADEAELSPATVVGILDKLEAKGLVARARSLSDRRSVHSRLTAEGAAMLARVTFPLGSDFDARFTALPPESRARMVAALDDLAALAGPEVSPGDEGRG
jgi:DNA-binding MarR family transcriptional regulator